MARMSPVHNRADCMPNIKPLIPMSPRGPRSESICYCCDSFEASAVPCKSPILERRISVGTRHTGAVRSFVESKPRLSSFFDMGSAPLWKPAISTRTQLTASEGSRPRSNSLFGAKLYAGAGCNFDFKMTACDELVSSHECCTRNCGSHSTRAWSKSRTPMRHIIYHDQERLARQMMRPLNLRTGDEGLGR